MDLLCARLVSAARDIPWPVADQEEVLLRLLIRAATQVAGCNAWLHQATPRPSDAWLAPEVSSMVASALESVTDLEDAITCWRCFSNLVGYGYRACDLFDWVDSVDALVQEVKTSLHEHAKPLRV